MLGALTLAVIEQVQILLLTKFSSGYNRRGRLNGNREFGRVDGSLSENQWESFGCLCAAANTGGVLKFLKFGLDELSRGG